MKTLREYRKLAGFTQNELARKAGIRQASLSSLENGKSSPHKTTILKLAEALQIEPEILASAIRSNGEPEKTNLAQHDWLFLKDLDNDLRRGLSQSLVADWTHSSTALEGNTIPAGDTLFILTEGLTVSGKSLREHQEIHGHAQALSIMSRCLDARKPITIESLHQLHHAIQTGSVIDAFNPIGKWKVEPNGTMAIPSSGKSTWHEYSHPRHIPALVKTWLQSLAQTSKTAKTTPTKKTLLDAYTDTHLGFVGIHPYADGNGRLARLVANIPLLSAGMPPLLISLESRREYITLLGDYSLAIGQLTPDQNLVKKGKERTALKNFFNQQWKSTLKQLKEFHQRQNKRNSE